MSEQKGHEGHPKERWIEVWWPALVIGYGIAFVVIVAAWHPVH